MAPGRGPAGAFAPRLLGLPSTSGALRLTLRMNGFSLPIHPSPHPFVLSVTEWSRRALRQSSPPNRMFGPGAQPRPQAPGCGAVFQVVIPSVTRNLHFSFSVIPDIFNRESSVVAFLLPLLCKEGRGEVEAFVFQPGQVGLADFDYAQDRQGRLSSDVCNRGSKRESGVLSSKPPPSEAFLLTYLQNVAIWKQ